MKIDQFAILRKLRNRLGCDDFSAITVLDVSPKQLIKEVGLPEYYFFNKRGD